MNERLLRLPEVMAITGKSKSSIYDDMNKNGTFPKSIPIGVRARAWRESDIQAWINERVQEAVA